MKTIRTLALAAAMVVGAASAHAANPYEAKANELAKGEIAGWLKTPVVIDAVKAQNAKNAALTEADIKALDAKWAAGDKGTIDPVLNNPLSQYLKKVQADSKGKYLEIFVTDNKGVNVGQSDKTSDIWQGDEPKFTEVFPKGASAIHLSDVKQDESTQAFVMQISVPVVDGGANIGTVTASVDAEMLR